MAAIVYEVRNVGISQPFYYYPSARKASWILNNNYTLVDAPDGFYISPPSPKYVESSGRSARGSLSRTRTISILKSRNASTCPSEVNLTETENIALDSYLEGNDGMTMEFMHKPFFPNDLFLLFDGLTIKKQLESLIEISHWSSKNNSKRNSMTIEVVLSPEAKALNGKLLKETPENLSNIVVSTTKTCKDFMNRSDHTLIVEILNRLEGHSLILYDVVLFLMIQTNTKTNSQSVRNAWSLLTIIISRFLIISPIISKILRSFMAIVASSSATSNDVRNFSMICLYRLSCKNLPKIDYDKTAPLLFFSSCYSPKLLFGVSLGEVIYKERVLNEAAKSDTLVPFVVRKLVAKLRLMSAFHTREIFSRKSISRTEKITTIQRLNKGVWEIDITNVHTMAAILRHFLKNLQNPILTDKVVGQLTPNIESYRCIQLANSIPNENCDTLMYVVGFLQELEKYEKETRMSAQRLAEALSPALVKCPETDNSEEKLKYQMSLTRFLYFLILHWKTDEVYKVNDE